MTSLPALEHIIARYVEADEAGFPPDVEQLLQKHPEFAEELRQFVEMHQRFSAAIRSAETVDERITTGTRTATGVRTELHESGFSSSLASNPPKYFGNYEIIEEIDRGGMGVVYKVRHLELSRIVALKLIRSGELASEEEIQRFRSEAEAAAALNHPGIVPIYEVGMLHGLFFYTMAFIEGTCLADAICDGPLDTSEAIRIVYKLCSAIEHAHQAGVFHRDLKPANVLIDKSGQPIIIDFGLAKISYRDSSLTATGQILGTPAYMAPEHAAGRVREVTAASDVYSLGAILYCLCTGQPPFSGATPFDVLMQVLDRQPPKPSKINRRVGRPLDYICAHALEKDPGKRYQSATDLAADLTCLMRGSPLMHPRQTVTERLRDWWHREPILAVHIYGISLTLLIVAVSNMARGESAALLTLRIVLLAIWLVGSIGLQHAFNLARWRDVACICWGTLDVAIYTALVAFATPPRGILLIGYPMLIIASGFSYRPRFVNFMTSLSVLGFLTLAWLSPLADFVHPSYAVIFLMGLMVISVCMLSIIRRVPV